MSYKIYHAVNVVTTGTTGTGFDQIVDVITSDAGILESGSTRSVNEGAQAANSLNQLILQGATATGALDDGIVSKDEVVAINRWIRTDDARFQLFAELHGDDEGNVETGYHLIQGNGGATQFGGQNFLNTVVDGIYHIGFEINADGRFENEDGDANASVESVARWLTQLYTDSTQNEGTPLFAVAWGILGDSRLYARIGPDGQQEAVAAADAMNAILQQGIDETAIATDGQITAADAAALNAWLRGDATRLNAFLAHFGNDDSGFYRAVGDASNKMFGENLVNNLAKGIYSLGFELVGDHVGSASGEAGASLQAVAGWLDYFLGSQSELKTGTGLDKIVEGIFDDQGLARKTSLEDIQGGAEAASGLNMLLLEAMDAVGARDDGWITSEELVDINAWVRADSARYARFVELHGDDEDGVETGYHLVQNDGSSLTYENKNLIDTVADGIYHFGFEIENGRFLNEDGNANQTLVDVASWLNALMTGAVTIRARGGEEAITWTESAAQVIDHGGNRIITTGAFADFVSTTWGSDTILTGAGDDLIRAGQGDNIVDGGEGSDTYLYVNSACDNFHGYDVIVDSGASGTDRIAASGNESIIGVKGFADSGIEVIDVTGVAGRATLLDHGTSNVIDLRGVEVIGTLVIDSNWGDDTVYGSDAAEIIFGGYGNDMLDGGGASDTYLYSGEKFLGHDTFSDTGASGTDRILAEGEDIKIGVKGFGSDSGIEVIDVTGVAGRATLLDHGTSDVIDLRGVDVLGTLVIDSNWGDDTVYGSDAAEIIFGGYGNDMLDGGGAGDTYLYSGEKFLGHDTFRDTGASGTDRILAEGKDIQIGVAGFGPASGIEVIDVTGVAGRATLLDHGSSNVIDLRGVEVLGRLVIDGNWGDDTIFGTSGQDKILGGGGNDIIDGGLADDALAGGKGRDIFHVTNGWGKDTITDFEIGRDKIDLRDSEITNFGELTLTQVGADTLVSTADGSFLLQGILQTAVTGASFMF